MGSVEVGPGPHVLGLNQEGQGLHRVEVGVVELLERSLELPGALALPAIDLLDLLGEHHELAAGRLELGIRPSLLAHTPSPSIWTPTVSRIWSGENGFLR